MLELVPICVDMTWGPVRRVHRSLILICNAEGRRDVTAVESKVMNTRFMVVTIV